MSSDESLSPTVSSRSFGTFADAKQIFDQRLAQYHRLNPADDTVDFLRVCFRCLPLHGKFNLTDDVSGFHDDAELRQLVQSIDTGLLRPMLAHGGATPTIIPSPRYGLEDSIENILSQDIAPITRADQQRLQANCLERDGHQCVVSKMWNPQYPRRPPRSLDNYDIRSRSYYPIYPRCLSGEPARRPTPACLNLDNDQPPFS